MSSVVWLRLLLILLLAVGHVSLWVWLYNRINAVGLQRATIKRLEKLVVLLCLLLPFVFLFVEWRYGLWGDSWQQVWDRIQEPLFYRRGSIATLLYFGAVLAFFAWTAPRWLAHRPAFAVAKKRYHLVHRRLEPRLHKQNPHWVMGAKTRYSLAIPGNEILSLETNIKILFIDQLDKAFEGIRIGHLSDIHLMGQISPDFTRYCADWVVTNGAELLVLSGDLVDDARAVKHLESAFSHLPSDLPKVFVLGNHDRAYGLVEPARDAMVGMGWLDAGARDWRIQTARGSVQILGSELPWLDRHTSTSAMDLGGEDVTASGPYMTLGVSHSPDRFAWARLRGCHLLLSGHTHGGQIRVPGIGPIISPSWHGSRFASGVFYKYPTVMHVSRGVSGTHPLRWRCPPEASVLELSLRPSETSAHPVGSKK